MKITLFFLVCFFSGGSCFSQNLKTDSITDLQKNVIHLYNDFTNGNAPIFNGPQYIYYNFKMEGDPYFITGSYSKGWIGYSGRVYDPVSIFYDIVRNKLVLKNADSSTNIEMFNEFIDSFHLLGHTFISLKEDHKQNLYNTGFYDLLYNGNVQLLARRIKDIKEKMIPPESIRFFYPRDRFYIQKDGIYYLVTNKKDVFRLLSNKKHEIKKMMRKNNINLNQKTFESSLLKVTAFYDQLTQ
ncbi:MAG: hypothetical protein ABI297_06455 [Ginsengibacter sp.]